MLDLGGKTALERCVERVQQFRGISEIIIATSTEVQDDVVVRMARHLGVGFYRGSHQDVLRRYTEAAREIQADAIVRCTSDCPLLDPEVSSLVIKQFLESHVDYLSNTLERRFPKGLDTEIFSMQALEKANHDAQELDEREHVTLHMYRNLDKFLCKQLVMEGVLDRSHIRWTLDTLEDYCFLSSIFQKNNNV